jgi:hypothetical protein
MWYTGFMMPVDYFYVSLSVGFLILVGCVVAVSVQLFRVLGDIKSVTGNLVGAVSDVVSVKENLKLIVSAAIEKFIDRIGERKGGGNKKKNDS